MTFIKYNQPKIRGVGLQLGAHQVLLYWYVPRNRPFVAYNNLVTNNYWRV